jgi:hypothetical protein
MWLLYVMLVAGPLVLVGAAVEARTQRRLRREGVRVEGTVVRHEVETDASTEGRSALFAIVAYPDAHGATHECRSVSSGTRNWPIGRSVPVVYLPQSPAKGRIDTASQRRMSVGVLLIVGLIFTALPLVLLAKH